MSKAKNFKISKKLRPFWLMLVLLASTSSYTQNSEVGNWFLYFGNQKINNRWNWHNEVQYRNYNFIGDLEQLIVRTGLGYNLTDNNNNVLLGYAYIYSEPYIAGTNQKKSTNEDRIFQQYITKQHFGRVNIQHRYRFEQRFIEEDFKMRLRYFFALNVAITKKELEKNAIYASAYNEIFINTEGPAYFDRDRIYGGIGFCFNKNLKMEVGFMSQIQENSSRTQFQIIFFNSLPF